MGKQVGNYIQKLRAERGFSTRQLSHRIDISHSHLSLVERGEREVGINTLYSIVEGLEGDFSYAVRLFLIDAGIPEEALASIPTCQ